MAKKSSAGRPIGTDQDAFLTAITQSPADDTPRLVYADWLEEHDDPDRAAFIRLQVERARLPADAPHVPDLESRVAGLLKEHKWQWLSELGVTVEDARFRRGFPEVVRMTAGGFLHYGRRLLRSAPISGADLTDLGDRADRLAASSLLAGLTALRLSHEDADVCRPHDVTPLFDSPHAAGLRRLTLGSGVKGNVAVLAASARLPRLRVLDLAGASPDLDCLRDEAPKPGLSGLVALNLSDNYVQDDEAQAVAATPHLGRLRQLGLSDNEITDAGALAIARSGTLRKLHYLDVSGNQVGDRGLRALSRREGLEALLVDWNRRATEGVIRATERKGDRPDWDWLIR